MASADTNLDLIDGSYLLVGENYDYAVLPEVDPQLPSPPPLTIATAPNIALVLGDDTHHEVKFLATWFDQAPPVRYDIPDWDEITDAVITTDSPLWLRTLEQEPIAKLTEAAGTFKLRLHARLDDPNTLERGELALKHYLHVWDARYELPAGGDEYVVAPRGGGYAWPRRSAPRGD